MSKDLSTNNPPWPPLSSRAGVSGQLISRDASFNTLTPEIIPTFKAEELGNSPLSISGTWPDDLVVGVPVTPFTPTVMGGTAPYTFSVIGTAPSGVSINPTTGARSGTPAIAGAYSFTIRVTDSLSATADLSVSGNVSSPPVTIPLIEIAANGYTATYDGTPPADPVMTTFAVSSDGFDASGNAVTRTWTNTITKRTRVPGTSGLSADGVALLHFVPAGSTITGVTNNSTAVVPKPIAMRLHLDGEIVGGTQSLRCQYAALSAVAWHGDARRQLARLGVRLTNITSGNSETITKWTTSEVILTPNGELQPLWGYEIVFSAAEMAVLGNGVIREDVIAVPWLGTSASIFDSADFSGPWWKSCASAFHVRDTTRASTVPFCLIDPVNGNNTTGIWATSGTPPAFLTIQGALAPAKTSAIPAGAYLPSGSLDGCEMRLVSGDNSISPINSGSNVQRAAAYRIILNDGANPLTTRATLPVSISSRLSGNATGVPRHVIRIDGVRFVRSTSTSVAGLSGVPCRYQFVNCPEWDNANVTGGLHNTDGFTDWNGVTVANYASPTFAQFAIHKRGLEVNLGNTNLFGGGVTAGCIIRGMASIGANSNVISHALMYQTRLLQRTAASVAINVNSGVSETVAENIGYVNVELDHGNHTNVVGVRISGDAETISTRQVIVANVATSGFNNATVGSGRWNHACVDTNATGSRTHTWNILHGIFCTQINTRHDDITGGDGPNAARIGGWAVDLLVQGGGYISTLFQNLSSGSRTFGPDFVEYVREGTSSTASRVVPADTVTVWSGAPNASTSNGSAGDFYPPPGSVLRTGETGADFATCPAFLNFDIEGRARSATQDWIGPYGANR